MPRPDVAYQCSCGAVLHSVTSLVVQQTHHLCIHCSHLQWVQYRIEYITCEKCMVNCRKFTLEQHTGQMCM